MAHLVAQHSAERGFREVAFCGDERFSWSRRRGGRFGQLIRGTGHLCYEYNPSRHLPNSDVEVDEIATWLAGLPKPVAVFACYDNRCQQVLGACRRVGLAVPETVAVLGGGLSLVGEPLRAAVAALPGWVMDSFHPGPRVVLAALREHAVPVGALVLARDRLAGR